MIYQNDLMKAGYDIRAAQNGFTFSSYDVTTDQVAVHIAANPQELAAIMTKWQENKIAGLLKYLASAAQNGAEAA